MRPGQGSIPPSNPFAHWVGDSEGLLGVLEGSSSSLALYARERWLKNQVFGALAADARKMCVRPSVVLKAC